MASSHNRPLFLGVTALFTLAMSGVIAAQTALPQVTVTEPHAKPKPKPARPVKKLAVRPAQPKPVVEKRAPVRTRVAARPAAPAKAARGAGARIAGATPGGGASIGPGAGAGGGPGAGAGGAGAGTGIADAAGGPAEAVSAEVTAARTSEARARAVRANLLPQGAATVTTITKQNIDALPQGNNTPFDRALLNLPGVTEDSAASGDLHIRNEHANVQYRINGIFLPEGISGFSQVLDLSFVRTLSLLDGALPAEYGLYTAGIIDIGTRNGADLAGGSIGVYGGSHGTILPTLTYGGTTGRWDYFFSGRYLTDTLGIENTTASHEAIHDRTNQGRYFAYISGLLEDNSRITFISGGLDAGFQIPNSPGAMPNFTAFGVSTFDSAQVNENQVERSIFNVLAWQKSFGAFDSQVSYFQRYSSLHFVPDTLGDLVFNGVASDVTRTSLVNGIQNDNAYRFDNRDTLRFGVIANVEKIAAINNDTVLPTDTNGNPIDAPFFLGDAVHKTGVIAGVYAQNEYRLTPQLTINGGLRFDYLHQYVDADQLSPRIGAVYTPLEGTTFHAGYARYFTPPSLSLGAPTPIETFANTTLAPETTQNSSVRPERSHYFDAGVVQRVLPGLDVGVDGYYKIAKNLLDDGQFGQALVLTAFNYDHAFNDGVELKINYQHDGFRAYGNLAVAQQRAKEVSSNQYLFGADEISYIANNYIFTDHDQLITVSGGFSYLYYGTLFSLDTIYGSGLRNGFANTGTVSPHAIVNIGLTHDFVGIAGKPLTARLAIENLLDHPYDLRDGSGIGVFAPQFGERRSVFAGLTQRF